MNFKGLFSGDQTLAKQRYLLLAKEAETLDTNIKALNIPSTANDYDISITTLMNGIIETISILRSIKQKEEEFDKLNETATQWFKEKLKGITSDDPSKGLEVSNLS